MFPMGILTRRVNLESYTMSDLHIIQEEFLLKPTMQEKNLPFFPISLH